MGETANLNLVFSPDFCTNLNWYHMVRFLFQQAPERAWPSYGHASDRQGCGDVGHAAWPGKQLTFLNSSNPSVSPPKINGWKIHAFPPIQTVLSYGDFCFLLSGAVPKKNTDVSIYVDPFSNKKKCVGTVPPF